MEKSRIFNTDDIKRILTGHKTQFREPIKPQPENLPNGKYRYDGLQDGIPAISYTHIARTEKRLKYGLITAKQSTTQKT